MSKLNLKKQSAELHSLYELSQLLSNASYADIDIETVLNTVCNLVNAKRGMIALFSSNQGDLHIEAGFGLTDEEKDRGHYAFGEGVIGQVVKTGQAMFVADIAKEPLFLNRTKSRNLANEAISYVCIPLRVDGRIIGALSIDFVKVKVNDGMHLVDLLGIIAAMLAPLINLRQEKLFGEEETIARKVKKFYYEGLVGTSESMQLVYRRIEQVASTNTTVLLRGESGTGKELVAHSLHSSSSRAEKPFVALNCAALPENLIESELFGHEKGAFTGAVSTRKGRFELADTGTLFLDEVGELSLLTQARLLRVLQEHSFERVGGVKSLSVDVRIIAATNRDLEEMVNAGTFRRDLYYRLNVFSLFLPPLRERQSDILLLANHFLKKYSVENKRQTPKIAFSTMDMLHRYNWPGNIRELENLMERGLLLIGKGEYLLPQHLPPQLHSSSCPSCIARNEHHHMGLNTASLPERIDELERSCIIEALEQHDGHIGLAAKSLGITERIMSLRLAKYNISYKKFR